jgi:diguanylate cyclase (GGDEF)-like protein
MLKGYVLQSWAMILILLAFAILLKATVFMDKTTIRRMYILIVAIFLLSIVVFAEFFLADAGKYRALRTVFMATRYSATPFILAQVIYTLIKKQRWFVFIPAMILTVIDFLSIVTGVVFRIGADGTLQRGPLGYLPFIVAGLYCAFLVLILFRHSNRQLMEIIPIAFLCVAFVSGLVLPFVFGRAYSQIFCTTIAIALFVYYVFLILQLTKKDSLTGLLNRQAYYADIASEPRSITALLSIDMNGLKIINDTDGHAAGDEALSTLALCFTRALKHGQIGYRVGGDEFVIVCRRASLDEVVQLVERIRKYVAETAYSCAVGYSFDADGTKSVDALLKESDDMMYEEKARYYTDSGKDRRKN